MRSRHRRLCELKNNVGIDLDAHLCKMFYSRLMRQPFAVARRHVGWLCWQPSKKQHLELMSALRSSDKRTSVIPPFAYKATPSRRCLDSKIWCLSPKTKIPQEHGIGWAAAFLFKQTISKGVLCLPLCRLLKICMRKRSHRNSDGRHQSPPSWIYIYSDSLPTVFEFKQINAMILQLSRNYDVSTSKRPQCCKNWYS